MTLKKYYYILRVVIKNSINSLVRLTPSMLPVNLYTTLLPLHCELALRLQSSSFKNLKFPYFTRTITLKKYYYI